MQHAPVRGLLLSLGAAALGLLGSGCSGEMTTGGTTGGPTCPDTLTQAPNADFCAAAAPKINCELVGTETNDLCGVPLKTPTAELKRSATVKEFAGSGPPQLGCFAPAGYPKKPAAGDSKTVQISGLAKIFSHGCESKQVKIEVFTEKAGAEGELGDPVGNAITTAANCMTGTASPNDACGTRYECNFIYGGVPSETPLVIKTSGDLWAPLYDFNVYIHNADVKNGVYAHDVRALASDDYSVIAQAAIGGPITAGNGALAGEVHDCGDVRLINAIVNVDQQKRVLTYFTTTESAPLPDLGASSTTSLGLYSALDMKPGPVTVAALGLVSGKPTTVGYHKAQIFPDAVTVVTFRGLQPYQVP